MFTVARKAVDNDRTNETIKQSSAINTFDTITHAILHLRKQSKVEEKNE
jgi:hypothetical protein